MYADMLAAPGFSKFDCRAILKRKSKNELVEFDVPAP
jgi:hypothetical protein